MKRLMILMCFVPVLVQAQFVAEAPVSKVEKDGFYLITVSPEMTAFIRADFSNVRILDDKRREVPFLVEKDKQEFSRTSFVEYPMEKQSNKDLSTLILTNSKGDEISNIILEVKNAEVVKNASLRGSDDKKTWYALKEHFTLGGFYNRQTTSELQILDFPLSNYKYYQVLIDDSTSTAPLNVLKAGYYTTMTNSGIYVEIPNVKLTSADSADRSTYAVVKFDTLQLVDKLVFEMEGPKFYHRDATLYQREVYYRKGVRRESLNSI